MYVRKKEFDEDFKLEELINNEFLSIKNFNEDFYFIDYNELIYERFVKISKLSYTEDIKKLLYTKKIDLYLKIIKYCKKYQITYKDVMTETSARELAKVIDKEILHNLINLSSKNNFGI